MTDKDFPKRVAVIGAGLLGGSVAMSLRRVLSETQFVAFARSEIKRKAATDSGVFNTAFTTIEETVRDCDAVVVASPVNHIANIVCQVAELTSPDCLITDVGSTKAGIVAEVEMHHLASRKFVAAHPIAGSEKTGLENADPSLFDGKTIVITPGNVVDPVVLVRAISFWQATGGETIHMTPTEHDTHLAAVSHVPHLVSCLVALRANDEARSLVGSGWRDITRVAAGDPPMWVGICRENRAAIAKELAGVRESLQQLCELVEGDDDDALTEWLANAKEVRDHSSG